MLSVIVTRSYIDRHIKYTNLYASSKQRWKFVYVSEIMWFYSETGNNEHADGRNHSLTLFFYVKWSAYTRKQTHVCIKTGFVYKENDE